VQKLKQEMQIEKLFTTVHIYQQLSTLHRDDNDSEKNQMSSEIPFPFLSHSRKSTADSMFNHPKLQ
jgi:hypothetical protein